MALSSITEEEKVLIRHHLGYPNMSSVFTYLAGMPATVPTIFLLEGAMDRILEPALGIVRRILVKLEAIEGQRFENAENMAVTRIGDIEINKDEQMQLRTFYDELRGQLANVMAVPVNCNSQVPGNGQSINGRVVSG